MPRGLRLAFLLAGLPIVVLVRMRWVLRRPAPARHPGTMGRTRRHGGEFAFADPATWGGPDVSTRTRLYGPSAHPGLGPAALPADPSHRLGGAPGRSAHPGRNGDPAGGRSSAFRGDPETGLAPAVVAVLWQAFLRRFDIEHTFRMLKQTPDWTTPKLRSPEAADRWTWLLPAACTQLRLARDLAADLRRRWEKPVAAQRLSPARIRRGFRHLRAHTGSNTALEGNSYKQVLEVLTQTELASGPRQIKHALDLIEDNADDVNEIDNYFKENILARGHVIVGDRDFAPDEGNHMLNWTQAYDPEVWQGFVNRTVDQGMIILDRVNASGRRKVRLRPTEKFYEA